MNFTLLEGTTKVFIFQIINLFIESSEVCLKCPDCGNRLFDSLVRMVDLTLPSQPSSPPIYLCFQRVTSIGQKKIYVHVMSKIIANLVYGLALHEFSVVQSG